MRELGPGMVALLACLALYPLTTATSNGFQPSVEGTWVVEDVKTPAGLSPEVGGLTFTPEGDLVVSFRRGQIYVRESDSQRWHLFAEGLKDPMGILSEKPGEFIVAQVPELTRIVDTDGDGKADLYQTLADDWGLSGNYHEFIHGPFRDPDGNLFLSLGCASGNAKPRPPVRGPMTTRGRTSDEMIPGTVQRLGHYSPVPYRGWVIQITPDGTFTPFASGFRQPNGLVLNAEGELFATDNQGGWVGSSPLYHVTKGAFLGHPASLNWRPDFLDRDPVKIPIAELERLRKKAAVVFPQLDMVGSVGQPVFDTTEGKFGPFAGQLLAPEWAFARIHRVYLEKIDGVYQGAAFPFLDGQGLRLGSHRLAFSPQGHLYVGQSSRIWGTIEGLQRVRWTGQTPFEILEMKLTPGGFDLSFTLPVDPSTAADPQRYRLQRYYYLYHAAYGSPKIDVRGVPVQSVVISEDGSTISLRIDSLEEGYIYELHLRRLQSTTGERLATRFAAYTLNRLYPGRED